MDDDFFHRDQSPYEERRDSLFGWTVLILLLIGLAFACWLGTYYVFGHPENPTSYSILKRLNRIDPPKRFELTAAPPGEFLTARKLYDRYISYSKLQLQNENAELLRNYISNYQDTKKLVPYVIGRFNILESYELKKNDIFSSGVVSLAQAADFPQVLLEHIYTAEPSNLPQLQGMLMPGLDIKLERSLDLSAIIHISRTFDGRLQFTVVPLLYGTYAVKQASGGFSLEPPREVRLQAGLPVLRTPTLQEAFRRFADARRKKGVPAIVDTAATQPAPQPEAMTTPEPTTLAQVEARPTPLPSTLTQETPATPVPVAKTTPEPAATPTPAPLARTTPKPTASPTPAELVMQSTPRPISTPRATPQRATAPPLPEPTAVMGPDGVPLKPFIASTAPEVINPTGRSWQLYPPGRMPRGRLFDLTEVGPLANTDLAGERVYLSGDFVVTASGENRAVLRDNAQAGSGSTRVIVEFPAGQVPPAEGVTFRRDEVRPFQINDVRRGADGQLNVYVREITTP